MVWNKLIQQDKITSVCAGFCDKVMERIRRIPLPAETDVPFRKKHVWMSIAAGIVMGLLMLNLQKYLTAEQRRAWKLQAWIECYYLDDMTLEEMDCHLF